MSESVIETFHHLMQSVWNMDMVHICVSDIPAASSYHFDKLWLRPHGYATYVVVASRIKWGPMSQQSFSFYL